MMKIFLKSSLLLLVVSFNAFGKSVHVPKEFSEIQCAASPMVNDTNKKITHPHVPRKEATGTSSNWAGYVAVTNINNPAAHSVTAVIGTWVVPAISSVCGSNAGDTYCSMWVGIDGYSDGTVEQIGTEHDWVNGQQQNIAWFEMYPNYPYEITGFPVNVGDSITGVVEYIGNNTFELILMNNTRKVYAVIPYSYTRSSQAQRSSAEWIMEAPYENGVLPLSNFGTVHFSNCLAIINGKYGPINDKAWTYEELTMVTDSGQTKAAPSPLLINGENFSVVWKHE